MIGGTKKVGQQVLVRYFQGWRGDDGAGKGRFDRECLAQHKYRVGRVPTDDNNNINRLQGSWAASWVRAREGLWVLSNAGPTYGSCYWRSGAGWGEW